MILTAKELRIEVGHLVNGIVNGMFGVLFTGLKLCNVIDWSWWWVLAPLWIPFLFLIIMCAIKNIYGVE